MATEKSKPIKLDVSVFDRAIKDTYEKFMVDKLIEIVHRYPTMIEVPILNCSLDLAGIYMYIGQSELDGSIKLTFIYREHKQWIEVNVSQIVMAIKQTLHAKGEL